DGFDEVRVGRGDTLRRISQNLVPGSARFELARCEKFEGATRSLGLGFRDELPGHAGEEEDLDHVRRAPVLEERVFDALAAAIRDGRGGERFGIALDREEIVFAEALLLSPTARVERRVAGIEGHPLETGEVSLEGWTALRWS